MKANRSWHGCDRIYSGLTRYLIVYGGHSLVGTTVTGYGDVVFLNMNSKSGGWTSIQGIQINKISSYINGGIVKQLTTGITKYSLIQQTDTKYN
jgi:hypothetical protein